MGSTSILQATNRVIHSSECFPALLEHSHFAPRTMEASPDSNNLVKPEDRDILIGRGHNVYNFIGNRRFRRLVDMFIQEYVESNERRCKSGLVRSVIDIAQASGYRFLKRDTKGIFAEISHSEAKMKVICWKCSCIQLATSTDQRTTDRRFLFRRLGILSETDQGFCHITSL